MEGQRLAGAVSVTAALAGSYESLLEVTLDMDQRCLTERM